MTNFIFCKCTQLKPKKDNRGFFRDYTNLNTDSYIFDLRKRNLELSINLIQGANDQNNLFHDELINNINVERSVERRKSPY